VYESNRFNCSTLVCCSSHILPSRDRVHYLFFFHGFQIPNLITWLFGALPKRSAKKHATSVCSRTHTADRTQPYTLSHAGKPSRRLCGSKQGPLLGGGDEVDACRGFSSLQGKRPKNALVWCSLARTQQDRRVHADQLLWTNRPSYCAPQILARCPVAEMKWQGLITPKPAPHTRGDPPNEWRRRAHVGDGRGSLSQNDTTQERFEPSGVW